MLGLKRFDKNAITIIRLRVWNLIKLQIDILITGINISIQSKSFDCRAQKSHKPEWISISLSRANALCHQLN